MRGEWNGNQRCIPDAIQRQYACCQFCCDDTAEAKKKHYKYTYAHGAYMNVYEPILLENSSVIERTFILTSTA